MSDSKYRFSSDLPLEGDITTRYLPWFIGIIVYLLVLSLTVYMLMQQAASFWNASLTGKVTIQISPSPDKSISPESRAADVLSFLQLHDAVESLSLLNTEDTRKLLEPWLGANVSELDLPLPILISVNLKKGQSIDPEEWTAELSQKTPGVLVDDHNTWIRGLIHFARGLQVSSLGILGIMFAACFMVVIYTTRMGLAIHQDVVDVLHLIGAKDSYIAWQFQVYTFAISIKGVLYGAAFGLITVLVISLIGIKAESLLLPSVHLSLVQWLLLLVIPCGLALIATLVARITVLRSLKQVV